MPRDLRVVWASEADFDFHSRYDARLRRYRYFALCSPSPDPIRLRYCHHIRRRPDIVSLNAAAALILGETDFTAFSSARDGSANRSRFVSESSFRWEGEALVYEIAANAFLWRMVRSLVGSMLAYEAAAPGGAAELMGGALAARDRNLAGPTAPARGLFLWNVEYYARPTRPGRGDYWTVAGKRGGEDSS
jgi:tRNA pseudouridine38-40 synthase